MNNDNDKNFVGGGMLGLPGLEATAEPRGEKVQQKPRRFDTHTPQTAPKGAVATTVDTAMRLVRFGDLEVGACFMREISPDTYITYTKAAHDKSWDPDYQVLIFNRHALVYIKALTPQEQAVEQAAEGLRAETRECLGTAKNGHQHYPVAGPCKWCDCGGGCPSGICGASK